MTSGAATVHRQTKEAGGLIRKYLNYYKHVQIFLIWFILVVNMRILMEYTTLTQRVHLLPIRVSYGITGLAVNTPSNPAP